MAVNRYFNDTKAWYAISTYSGYEDKVADSIRQRLDSVEMVGKIFDVIVPKEKQIEIKNGKRRIADVAHAPRDLLQTGNEPPFRLL